MALQNLRSGVANKRPIPTIMSEGQIALNTNEASPGLFFKDSNGDLVKVGPVHIGTSAPNSSPASTAATALVTGATYQILTVGTSDFTLVGASANTVGTIFTATGTTTGTGTVSGQQGVEKGEQWLDTTGGNYVLKIYDGTAWRSEAGEFVNVSGDTMTGALLLDNAASVSAPDLSFDGDANTGIYSPGADQFGVATGGTAALTIDASQQVGIGTTSPGNNLDIAVSANSEGINIGGSGNFFGLIQYDANRSGADQAIGDIAFKWNGTRVARIIGGTGTDTTNKDDGVLQFHTASAGSATEKMRIDSSGNVGIGRTPFTSPAGYPLQLRGGSQVFLQMSTSGHGDTATDGLSIGADGSSAYITQRENAPIAISTNNIERMRIESDGDFQLGGSTNYAFIRPWEATTGNLIIGADQSATGTGGSATIFRNRGSESMRIDSSGRLLVGTSSTRAMYGSVNNQFQIEGSSHATSSMSLTRTGGAAPQINLASSANSSFGLVSNGGDLGFIAFMGADGSAMRSAAYIGAEVDGTPGTNDMPGRLIFATTADGASSPTERLRIDSSGFVGIGDTSPSSYDSGARNLVVGSSGDTGILIKAGTSSYSNLYFGDGTGTASYRGFVAYNHNGDSLRFGAAGSERMRIDSSGNVGIGTSSPRGLLHVGPDLASGATDAARINLKQNGLAATDGIYLERSGERRGYHMFIGGPNDGLTFRANNFGTFTTTMYLTRDGKVGIGTTSPNAILEASSSVNTTGAIRITNSNSGTGANASFIAHNGTVDAAFGIGGTNYTTYAGIRPNAAFIYCNQAAGIGLTADNASGFINFVTGGSTERARIDSSGRLLVGTSTDTTARLVVKGSAGSGDDGINVISGSTTVGSKAAIFFSPSTSGSFSTGSAIKTERLSPDGSDLQFYTCTVLGSAPSERMRIDSSGVLLVGKTAVSSTTPGVTIDPSSLGYSSFINNTSDTGSRVIIVNRQGGDGRLIEFRESNTVEGYIQVSGTTVSLVGAHLSRWSQLPNRATSPALLRGTVLTNLDEMCEWDGEDNQQLNRMKVSDIEGDPNVAGVLDVWDEDKDHPEDFNVAMTGDFVIRIAQGTTVARGDLLMSAGDGTAKPQDDDIVRSKTIAKVTSTTVSETYADNSYCVPCVLMAC